MNVKEYNKLLLPAYYPVAPVEAIGIRSACVSPTSSSLLTPRAPFSLRYVSLSSYLSADGPLQLKSYVQSCSFNPITPHFIAYQSLKQHGLQWVVALSRRGHLLPGHRSLQAHNAVRCPQVFSGRPCHLRVQESHAGEEAVKSCIRMAAKADQQQVESETV